ncbi:MAG: Gfo/Idh/MocA family oxidoreductase [Pirellulales bacterium]
MRRRDFCRIGWQGTAGLYAATAWNGLATAADAQSAGKKIKIGQIGTGHSHAAGKLDTVRKQSELYEFVGVAEGDAGLLERAKKHLSYSGVAWLTEDELLAVPELKAVVVETELARAAATAAKAIAAGKHIHLDKPGAVRHSEFRGVRSAAEERGLCVQMGYMLRYNPAFQLLFQAVREGWFGDVLEIDCSMGKLANDGLRRELGEIPGAGMFELACHLVDAVVTVLGRPQKVHALGKSSRSDDPSLADNQLAIFEYDKATATIRCNHSDPFGGPHRRFQLVGTRGGMEILPLESGQGRLWLSEPHGAYKKGEQSVAFKISGRYDGEFVDLAKVVRGEKQLAWTPAHDIAVHESVLRAAGVWADE